MTAEQFEQSLRDLLRREPFQPFTVEYTHGDRFAIDSPDHVALSGGAAGYLGADVVYFFDHTNVSRFLPSRSEAHP